MVRADWARNGAGPRPAAPRSSAQVLAREREQAVEQRPDDPERAVGAHGGLVVAVALEALDELDVVVVVGWVGPLVGVDQGQVDAAVGRHRRGVERDGRQRAVPRAASRPAPTPTGGAWPRGPRLRGRARGTGSRARRGAGRRARPGTPAPRPAWARGRPPSAPRWRGWAAARCPTWPVARSRGACPRPPARGSSRRRRRGRRCGAGARSATAPRTACAARCWRVPTRRATTRSR